MQARYRKKQEHNPDNYLKAILESIEYYNAHERLDVARWLYKGYEQVGQDVNAVPTRNAIILEIESKFIQEIEDLAIICLMFAGTKLKCRGKPIIQTNKLPFEIYVNNVRNQRILDFYTIAKNRLGKNVISAIYGYKTPQQLLKEGAIRSNELPFFISEIDKLYQAGKANLSKIGLLYSFRKKRGGNQEYGKFVQTYFKTKHGFKVLQPTETTKLLWQCDATDILLVSETFTLKSGRRLMSAGLYKWVQ